jgi:PHP family Zn ribbon phosphoesterase
MPVFSADLHIHTVLSPCGDLDMSPVNIVKRAKELQLDIIGITDHNSTRHCPLIQQLAAKEGIFVLCGAEVTTLEEAHCLCFMPDLERLDKLQSYFDLYLMDFMNDVNKFGYQVQVDEEETIVYEEPKLLIQSINRNINQVEEFTHSLGGLFIPAHINRPAFSLISQLGFIPDDLNYDALEIYRMTDENFCNTYNYRKDTTLIRNSDAHQLNRIGAERNFFNIEELNFQEIKLALLKQQGSFVK